MNKNLWAFVGILGLLSLPQTTQAGLISAVSNFFKGEVEASTVELIEVNSQNMPLLHAAVNTNPVLIKGSSDISVVNGSSLLSQAGPVGTLADIVDEPKNNGQISTYIVRNGDTLSEIALMFGVSVNTIVWANDIQRGIIKEGQTLVILPITGIQYKIKSGDTLKSVVQKYKADLQEVMDYNGLSEESVLKVGDIITIPDAEIVPVITPAKSNASKVTVPPHNTNGPSYPGYFIRPLVGGVKTQGLHGYNAVDIASPIGTSIYAAAQGTVIISSYGSWNHGYGNYIVISHPNGVQTLYAHASKLLVSTGDSVEKGQVIAEVGSTGKSTGPHLHFEIRGAKNPF
jgi:LysM repeat protein